MRLKRSSIPLLQLLCFLNRVHYVSATDCSLHGAEHLLLLHSASLAGPKQFIHLTTISGENTPTCNAVFLHKNADSALSVRIVAALPDELHT
jgi:hypothetical protein